MTRCTCYIFLREERRAKNLVIGVECLVGWSCSPHGDMTIESSTSSRRSQIENGNMDVSKARERTGGELISPEVQAEPTRIMCDVHVNLNVLVQ
jgi:hypothetical protein